MRIVYRGTSDTGLKEVKNTAGMATPQAFIRKKCQSIIRCSLVVKASYNQTPRSLQKAYKVPCFGSTEMPFVKELFVYSFSETWS